MYYQQPYIHSESNYPVYSMCNRLCDWLLLCMIIFVYMHVSQNISCFVSCQSKNVQESTHAAFLLYLCCECDGQLPVHSKLSASPISLLMLVCPHKVAGFGRTNIRHIV